jgi:hypothetical protein
MSWWDVDCDWTGCMQDLGEVWESVEALVRDVNVASVVVGSFPIGDDDGDAPLSGR